MNNKKQTAMEERINEVITKIKTQNSDLVLKNNILTTKYYNQQLNETVELMLTFISPKASASQVKQMLKLIEVKSTDLGGGDFVSDIKHSYSLNIEKFINQLEFLELPLKLK